MKRAAFTLIELMIVIVIMGVVYNLASSNLTRLSKDNGKITLTNLKTYLQSQHHEKSVQLLCLDDCSACDVYIDGVKTRTLDALFKDSDVRVYRYDFSYGYTAKEQDVYFNKEGVEENVCFSYTIDKEGIGEQVLMESKNKFYDYSSYFDSTKVYSSLSDASNARDELAQKVMR
ncbi:MAG: type II secretion system protein [Sulfurimonas sp.]